MTVGPGGSIEKHKYYTVPILLTSTYFVCISKQGISLLIPYWSTRPTTVPAGSDHYFHAECPSVPKLQNQATITAGRDCGLAEWIIDDSCLVNLCFLDDKIEPNTFSPQMDSNEPNFLFRSAVSLRVTKYLRTAMEKKQNCQLAFFKTIWQF